MVVRSCSSLRFLKRVASWATCSSIRDLIVRSATLLKSVEKMKIITTYIMSP
jgi:hypothetical protein